MRLIPEPGSPLDRISAFVMANLLWFGLAVFILPLPAATAGLVAVFAPWVRDRESEVFATFFGTMRRLWLKSTVIILVDALVGAVVVVNFQALEVMQLEAMLVWPLRGMNMFVVLSVLMMNIYAWPLLVLFDLPLRRLLNLSWRFAFGHLFWSLFILALAALPILLGLIISGLFILVMTFSSIAYIINWGAWRIIRKYATPEELAELGP